MNIKTGAGALVGVALLAAADMTPERPVLVWNASASVPIGFYLVLPPRPLRIGDNVLVRLSGPMRVFAERRGYVGPGTPLLKRVAAMDGDWVCRLGQAVSVSGRQVVSALGTDRAGKPLPVWQGCHQLRDGQVFVLGTHLDSFDSRYFGPIDREQILGTAIPLLIP